jgi:ABC-type glycerol-3-phosphate transport system substrate-binding protein
MNYSMVSRWSHASRPQPIVATRCGLFSRIIRAAFLLASASNIISGPALAPVSAQDFKEPDYSKFKPEEGQISLEVWSWVVGLDKAAKLFEQAYPNIKVTVNNVGNGPVEYQKLQTAIKAGSGGPDVAQVEFMFLPSFIVTDGLTDLAQYGANDVKSYSFASESASEHLKKFLAE